MSIDVLSGFADLKARWSARRAAPVPAPAMAAGFWSGGEAAEGRVRMEKVAPVQAALAAGTYNVPARAVAAKMVDAMLAGERKRLRWEMQREPAGMDREARCGPERGGGTWTGGQEPTGK